MNATPLPRVRPIPFGRWLVALLLLLPLTAVAAESAAPEGSVYELPENPDELLRVDDEMRAFFAPRIPHTHSVERRIVAIVGIMAEGFGEEAVQSSRRFAGSADVGGRLEFAVVRHAVQELIGLTEKLLGGWPFRRGAGEGLGRWVRRHEKMGEQPMDFGAERGGGVFLAG